MSKFIPLQGGATDRTLNIYRVKPKFVTYPSTTQPSTSNQNLFAGSSDLLGSISDHEKGPKLDSNGNIIKYTLVGSVESHNVEKQRRNKVSKVKLQVHHDNNDALSERSSRTPQTKSSNDIFNKVNGSTKNLTFNTAAGKKKNKLYKEIIMSAEEVRKEVEAVKQRVTLNDKQNAQSNQSLRTTLIPGDALQVNNFERSQRNFQTMEQNWLIQDMKVAATVDRPREASLNARIYSTREKKEMQKLLEVIQPPEIRYGNKFWQLGLRQPYSKLNKVNPHNYLGKEEEIEIVRRNGSSTSVRPFTSFSSRQYLDKKLSENGDLIKKYIESQTEHVGELELVGTNVLQSETKSLQQPRTLHKMIINADEVTKFIKKTPLHQTQDQDEVIAIQYDRRKLILNGKYGQLKSCV